MLLAITTTSKPQLAAARPQTAVAGREEGPALRVAHSTVRRPPRNGSEIEEFGSAVIEPGSETVFDLGDLPTATDRLYCRPQ